MNRYLFPVALILLGLGLVALAQNVTSSPSLVQKGFFYANRAAAQTGLTAGAYNKIGINVEVADVEGWYDPTTNFRYTPLMAGLYCYFAQVTAVATATDAPQAAIFKNGVAALSGVYGATVSTAGGNFYSQVMGCIAMNGTTDFVELYIYLPLTVTAITTGADRNFYGGWRASP